MKGMVKSSIHFDRRSSDVDKSLSDSFVTSINIATSKGLPSHKFMQNGQSIATRKVIGSSSGDRQRKMSVAEQIDSALGNSALDNWVRPKKSDFAALSRSTICEICHNSISFSPLTDAICIYCNSVSHMTCLQSTLRRVAVNNEGSYVCSYCISELEYSKKVFISKKRSHILHDIQTSAQVRLSKAWRRYFWQRRFREFMIIIRFLQLHYRARLKWKIFKKYCIGKQRPIFLSLESISLPKSNGVQKNANVSVCVTVVDDRIMPETQRSLVYSNHASCDLDLTASGPPEYAVFSLRQRLLLPAVAGTEVIVLTVLLKRGDVDKFAGQAVIRLADYMIYRRGGTFNLKLNAAMYFPISEIDPEKTLDFDYKSTASTSLDRGKIEVKIESRQSLVDACCGQIVGPETAELAKIVKQIPRTNAVTIPNMLITKKAIGNASSLAMATLSSKKMFVALADHRLFVYSRYGDSNLRLIIDLSQFDEMKIEPARASVTITFKKKDFPALKYQTLEPGDVLPWTLALSCAWRKTHDSDFSMGETMRDLLLLRREKKGARGGTKLPSRKQL